MSVPDDDPSAEEWSADPDLADDDVAMATTGFFILVDVAPADAGLARHGIAAIVRSLADLAGPDAPTPGMLGIPVLIEDPLARAALAAASPAAREPLGDLERDIVRMGPARAAAAAARIRAAIREADARLGGSST